MHWTGQERAHNAHLLQLSLINTGLCLRNAKYLKKNFGIGGGEGTEYFIVSGSTFVSVSCDERERLSANRFIGILSGEMPIISQQTISNATASFETAIMPVGLI